MKYFLVILFLAGHFSSFCQNTDSLKTVLKTAKDDTVKVIKLNKLARQLLQAGDSKDAKVYADQSLLLSQKLKYKVGECQTYNIIGLIYKTQGDYSLALKSYETALKIQTEANDKGGAGNTIINIANIYKFQGNYPEALRENFKALKMLEEVGDKKGIANVRNNIGVIYKSDENYEQALTEYRAALKIQEELGDKKAIANAHSNIGVVYRMKENLVDALAEYRKAMELRLQIGDMQGVANSHSNIGIVYAKQGDLPAAMKEYQASQEINLKMGDKMGIALGYNNIGLLYLDMKDFSKAKEELLKAIALAKEIGSKDALEESYNGLSVVDSALGNQKEALAYYKLYIIYKDSLRNDENTKKNVQAQMNFEFNKKQTADSLKVEEVRKLNDVKFGEEKKQRYFLYTGLFLVIVFAAFMFNRFKVTNAQKKIISQQKNLVEEKHKEITDSINYAERIQRSFLATKEMLDENLGEYFVFFKPKDVVSGDFYWAGKLKNGSFAFVTADSTGHGVPGAIMSLLNITSLEKAVEQYDQPHEILNHTRNIIIERLKKDGSPEGGKDGMDCSVLVFNKEKNRLTVALANNPVWIIRQGRFIEYKGDKMPVGKHDKQDVPFSSTEIELFKGDVIYTLTDGFADQFGGEKGKKFKYKALQELLSSVASQPMAIQEKKLNEIFENWKGGLEQIDDVCVIGIRL